MILFKRIVSGVVGTTSLIFVAACGPSDNGQNPTPVAILTDSTAIPTQPSTINYCQNEALALGWGQSEGAAGTAYRTVIISNISKSDCTISTLPQLFLMDGSSDQPLLQIELRTGLSYAQLPLQIPASGVLDISIGTANPDNFPTKSCVPAKATALVLKNFLNDASWTYNLRLPKGETSWNFCTTPGNTPFIASFELEIK
jgi:hypothetical protein